MTGRNGGVVQTGNAEARESESYLSGAEVAITGRLGSMDRSEAIARIHAAGGRYVELPTASTDLLVVGFESWPLANDGKLTKSLEIAQRLQQDGSPITITSEEDFLVTLGMQELQVGLHRLYTTEQLARMLDVSVSAVRAWVRDGLIEPARQVRRLSWFDFRQVANVRALVRLQKAGATTRQIRNSLEQLRALLPSAEVSLTQLDVLEGDGSVLVRLEDGRLSEPNGQLHLDFGAARERSTLAGPSAFARGGESGKAADEWFDLGVTAESEGRLEDAVSCYMNGLLAGGPEAETCFNLGNALYSLGRNAEAMQRFLQAIELDPDYVEAWNNLGNCLAQQERPQEAVNAYSQAIELEPNYADAYCNRAESLEQLGREQEAIQDWKEYLKRDPDSAWARQIRQRLED